MATRKKTRIIKSFDLFTITAVSTSRHLCSCQNTKCSNLAGILFTGVLDNMQPALSKTFQDFGFFFNINQTVTIASNRCLSKGGNNKAEALKFNVGWNEPICFHPPISVFLLDLEADKGTISPWESKLAMF